MRVVGARLGRVWTITTWIIRRNIERASAEAAGGLLETLASVAAAAAGMGIFTIKKERTMMVAARGPSKTGPPRAATRVIINLILKGAFCFYQ
jgi:hypothetical protein